MSASEPVLTTVPLILFTPETMTLSLSEMEWDAVPDAIIVHWTRDGQPINQPGPAHGLDYQLLPRDVGASIGCNIVGEWEGGYTRTYRPEPILIPDTGLFAALEDTPATDPAPLPVGALPALAEAADGLYAAAVALEKAAAALERLARP